MPCLILRAGTHIHQEHSFLILMEQPSTPTRSMASACFWRGRSPGTVILCPCTPSQKLPRQRLPTRRIKRDSRMDWHCRTFISASLISFHNQRKERKMGNLKIQDVTRVV